MSERCDWCSGTGYFGPDECTQCDGTGDKYGRGCTLPATEGAGA